VPGVDVAVVSAVPIAAGLSSSAALESSLAIALADLLDLPTDDAGRAALAAACVRAENVVAGAPTGGMDQAASLRATDGHALLLDTRDGSVQQVPLALAEAGLALLVMDTRAQHSLSDGQYGARRDACERAARLLGVGALAEVAGPGTDVEEVLGQLGGDDEADTALLRRRVRHVVTETTRVHEAVALLRQVGAQGHADRYRRLGRLLDASHTSLRDDYEVSSPELDAVVEAARGAGALGARMTGGGFGGSAVALVETGAAGEVAAAVRAAALGAGHPEPAFLLAEASGGAARVR
jgi:galactokinase